MRFLVAVALYWIALPVVAVLVGCLAWIAVENIRRRITLRRLWNDRRPGYIKTGVGARPMRRGADGHSDAGTSRVRVYARARSLYDEDNDAA
jgi:hypothetical protein